MNTLNLALDTSSKVKLYHQLYTKLSAAIESGDIATGKKIPSVRILAEDLGVSRNTITRAYKELEDEGYLYSLAKSGFYAKKPSDPIPERAQPGLKSAPIDDTSDAIPTVDAIVKLRQKPATGTISAPLAATEEPPTQEEMGHSIIDAMLEEPSPEKSAPQTGARLPPDEESGMEQSASELLSESHENIRRHTNALSALQTENSPATFEAALLDSYRVALTEKAYLLRKSSGTFGDESFRVALAAFMYSFHHIDVHPAQIIVGSCIEQLLYNVLRLHSVNKPYSKKDGQGLLSIATQVAEGGNVITPSVALCEDPDHTMRHVFMDANIQVKEIPIDEKGLIFNFVVTSGCNLIYASPADVPMGNFEEVGDRREEILSWASDAPYRYIIEFDTDTIKRRDITFKAHDKNDKVIYLNSFKNLLDKGVNASWMALPKKLAAEYTARYTTFDCTLSYLDQVALTDFIIKGKLENYLATLEQL